MTKRSLFLLLGFCTVLCVHEGVFGQDAPGGSSLELGSGLTKDQLLSQLETRKSQLKLDQSREEMERAKADFEDAKKLFDAKVYTIDEFNGYKRNYQRAKLSYEQASIELKKTRLELLKNATLITVVDAKKYRSDDGVVMVSVRLRNDSDLDQARIAMGGEKSVSRRELASLLTIDNVVVSLIGRASVSQGPQDQGRQAKAIVGDPFQHIVRKLGMHQERTLEYTLLKKDVEDITLELTYLGKKHSYSVFLKKEATQDLPTVNSTQYAQQGQLGTKIKYDLVLERLAKTEQSFSLVVLNLPDLFPYSFVDPASGARITHLKFSGQISKQSLNFELSVPKKMNQEFIDRNVEFSILVCRKAGLKDVHSLQKKYPDDQIPAEELAKIKANRADLILIPTGSGKLEIVIANLYKEVKREEPVQIKITLLNAGTMELRKVAPVADFPVEWEGKIEPTEIEELAPGQKRLFTITCHPPEDVAVGEYTLRVSGKGYSGIETIEATEKNVSIHVVAKANIAGTFILVLLIVGLVLGMVIASIKISRR